MDFCVPFPDVSAAKMGRLLSQIKDIKLTQAHSDVKSRIEMCRCITSLSILDNLFERTGEDAVHEELAALSSAMIKQRIQVGVAGTGHIPICVTALNLTSVVLALRRYAWWYIFQTYITFLMHLHFGESNLLQANNIFAAQGVSK